jgi:hypothetical protein
VKFEKWIAGWKNGVVTFYFFIFADTAPLRGIYKK